MTVAKRLHGAAAPRKEPEADALIRQQIGNQPDALYLLTQAVIVQEFGLRQAKERVTQLETEVQQARSQPQAPQQGGFLGGLLGGQQFPTKCPRWQERYKSYGKQANYSRDQVNICVL